MAFEVQSSGPESQPPNLIIVGVASNVDSWDEQTMSIPISGEKAFTQRMLILMVLRAINAPTAVQIPDTTRASTWCILERSGQQASIHTPTRIYGLGATGQSDAESAPMAWWNNPFHVPVRGGDNITVFVPGDADATPIQDWELECLFGPELQGRR